jgi:hypothetical protein
MRSWVFIVLLLVLVSCKDENTTKKNTREKMQVGTQTNIECLFDETTFASPDEYPLLKELKICDDTQKDLNNHDVPACNPKFFKFYPFIENKKLKDAFVLLIKSRVQGFPLRRVLVFEREGKELVKVNGFVANLIGKRKSASKHDDLILRFNDKVGMGEVVFYNCLYVWKDKHYVFKQVEQINDANIKTEFQDSMNVEIETIIANNRMVF